MRFIGLQEFDPIMNTLIAHEFVCHLFCRHAIAAGDFLFGGAVTP